MIRTRGLTHLALAVRDAERAFRFYHDVFGMEAMYREPGFIQAQTPGAWDVLVFQEDAARAIGSGGIRHFGFRLTELAGIVAAAERIEAAGGTIVKTGEFCPGEPYVFFTDPDGYEVEVWYELPTPLDPPLPRSMGTRPSGDSDGVEGGDGILVVRGAGDTRGWNGIRYKAGLSAKNVGAGQLSMNVATIPPGGVAYAHIHVDFEVMLYILEGRVRHEFGPGLSSSIENTAGDFIFIEPGIPHEVLNLSETERVVAVVARSDATEWEHIADYPSTRRPRSTG